MKTMILETAVDRFRNLKNRMNTCDSAFADAHPEGESATRPLARLCGRLTLSLSLAGMSLLRCRFAPDTRPDAPSGASNYRF